MNTQTFEHYICMGGCEGVSDHPGTCQAKECPHYGQPLEKCICLDGEHDRALSSNEDHDAFEEEDDEQ